MLHRITALLLLTPLAAACVDEPAVTDDVAVAALQSLPAAPLCPPVEPLAPGVLSTAADEGRIVFTPDGETAYFHVADQNFIYTIMESRLVDGAWTTPVPASFSGGDDIDPFVTDDGQELWFSSWRGRDGGPARPDTDLWKVTRVGDGWSEPQHVALSTDYFENFPSLTPDGTLYFNTNRLAATPSTFDGWEIYSAKRTAKGHATPRPLPGGVNTPENWEFNPAPIAGGRLLVFASIRESGHGGPDLYASLRVGPFWLPAINLGPCVNTAAGEFHPSFSAARGALTFVRFSDTTAGDFYDVTLGF